MAMQKTKPAPKKMVAAKKTATTADKPKTTKTTVTAKKVVAKKATAPVAKPKNVKTPAVKKAAAPVAVAKPPEKKVAPAKVATAKIKPATKKIAANPTPEERYRMVETAAYFIAERHGFQGDSTEHWADAEKEIAEKLRQ